MSKPTNLNIIMYHYVRDTTQSPYPGIHALCVSQFTEQLDYLQSTHAIISPDDLIGAVRDGENMPDDAVLLTFDDGYVDHVATVLPVLADRGLKGAFFPAASPLVDGRMIDANKIQFIRAAIGDDRLEAEVWSLISRDRERFSLPGEAALREDWSQKGRLDSNSVRLVKNLLQKGLPRVARQSFIDELFANHVTADEGAFIAELYATREQLIALIEGGHHVGNHGHAHEWLDRMDAKDAASDISKGRDFIQSLGVAEDAWIMCYPYGGYTPETAALAAQAGAVAGFLVEFNVARIGKDDPLMLPRLDTNQFPPIAPAQIN